VIHHVALECADPEAEVAFWKLLGFEEVPAPNPDTRWLERAGTQVHLQRRPETAVAGHVAVVVEDYERLRAELGGDPREEYWGAPRTQVRSPAGHLVELMAWAPPSS
jgi:catechol 2,3-dioxygenase-like lactoylglutathione lyase family enzyme